MTATTNQTCFPDVTLEGDGVTLRPFTEADIDEVLVAATDELTQQWLPLPRPYTRDHARWFCLDFPESQRSSGTGLVRAVEAQGRLVGAIDLKSTDWAARTTQVGYWSSPPTRGRGFMTAAVRCLAAWAVRDQDLERVELLAATGNVASQRVAEKAGFQREGVARNAGRTHGGRVDLVVYSLIPADLG
jgi:ribosomal-protein-serine acetyltransferase